MSKAEGHGDMRALRSERSSSRSERDYRDRKRDERRNAEGHENAKRRGGFRRLSRKDVLALLGVIVALALSVAAVWWLATASSEYGPDGEASRDAERRQRAESYVALSDVETAMIDSLRVKEVIKEISDPRVWDVEAGKGSVVWGAAFGFCSSADLKEYPNCVPVVVVAGARQGRILEQIMGLMYR